MKLISFIFSLSRKKKFFILLVIDTIILYFSYFFSIILRFENNLSDYVLQNIYATLISAPISIFFALKLCKFDKYVVRSYSFSSIQEIFKYSIATLVIIAIITFYFYSSFPRSILIVLFLIFFFLILLSRICIYNFYKNNISKNHKKIVIYGFDEELLFSMDHFEKQFNVNVLAIIDDKKISSGSIFNFTEVYSEKEFEQKHKKIKFEEIWISKKFQDNDRIRNNLNLYKKPIKFLKNFYENLLLDTKLQNNFETKIAGRKFVKFNENELKFYNNKIIIVTGAGGTIGSELCKQILNYDPKMLILFDHNEYSLHKIYSQITNFGQSKNKQIVPILGSIIDLNILNFLFEKYEVDVIVNAAAYKHVELVQKNFLTAFRNNVLGMENLLSSIPLNRKISFIQISTDKASKPLNIMGFSKFICECMINQYKVKLKNTNFTTVRFGNVINSSGSVIPIFKKQIEKGGPVTVTDPKMERYLMSVSEAVKLVLLSHLATDNSSDCFVLDMGKPVKILDIAKLMIKSITGLDPKDSSIEIKFTGIKEGEKIYEEPLINENSIKTKFDKIYFTEQNNVSLNDLDNFLDFIKKFYFKNDINFFKKEIKSKFAKFISKDFN